MKPEEQRLLGRIVATVLPVLFIVSVSVCDILKGDAKNYIVLCAETVLKSNPVSGIITATGWYDLSLDSAFIETLTYVPGSTYAYRAARQFDSVGMWHIKFAYTDSVPNQDYVVWATDVVHPDTLSQQGSAAGITAISVWQVAESLRTVVGWGGADNYLVTLCFKDASDSSAIQGVSADVYDTTTSNPAHRGGSKPTGNLGTVWYLLDNDNYDVRSDHNNYVDAVTEIAVPASDFQDTIYLTPFDPGNPPSAAMVRVYGYVKDQMNQPAIGVIVRTELTGAQKIWYKTVALTPYWRQDTTDASGYWEMDLFPNDSLTPATTKYAMQQIDTAGVISDYKFAVPGDSSGGSWQFTR